MKAEKLAATFGPLTLIVAFNLVVLEAFSFLTYEINPLHIFSKLYYDTIFAGQKMPSKPYGWDAYEGVRDVPSREAEDCGVAFGDSFTWGEEVADAEAWPYLVSRSIGCNIVNYGVGGFGSDQAYIKLETVNPKTRLVIFGIYQEMLRRNFAASWAFYAGRSESTIKPMFLLEGSRLVRADLPASHSIDDVRAYHERDRFYYPFEIRFPYALSMLKVLYYGLNTEAFDRRMLVDNAFTDDDSVRLEALLLGKVRDWSESQGAKVAVLFFPSPAEAKVASYPYRKFMERLSREFPDVCIIDPGPILTKGGGDLKAPNGHFNAFGNSLIADVVIRTLGSCGLIHR